MNVWTHRVGVVCLVALAHCAVCNVAVCDEAGEVSREEASCASPAGVWDGFLEELRRGDLPGAYELFTTSSRRAMPYEAFARQYHPFGALYQAIFQPREQSQFRVSGDVAEFVFLAGGTDGADALRVRALLVHDDGRWGLVAPARAEVEVTEAYARNVLRQSLQGSAGLREALASGETIDAQRLQALFPAARASADVKDVFSFYRIASVQEEGVPYLLAVATSPAFRSFVIDPALRVAVIPSDSVWLRERVDEIRPVVHSAPVAAEPEPSAVQLGVIAPVEEGAPASPRTLQRVPARRQAPVPAPIRAVVPSTPVQEERERMPSQLPPVPDLGDPSEAGQQNESTESPSPQAQMSNRAPRAMSRAYVEWVDESAPIAAEVLLPGMDAMGGGDAPSLPEPRNSVIFEEERP